jgi:hypothetical protein
MSWKARRYIPGKPVLRAIRHRKKILSKYESDRLQEAPATQQEISEALIYARRHGLTRLAEIIYLADKFSDVDNLRAEYREAYFKQKAECSDWKLKYLQERQKVLALQKKIGSLKQSRQNTRTRMRARGRTSP